MEGCRKKVLLLYKWILLLNELGISVSFIVSITVVLWGVMNTAASTSLKLGLLALFYYKLQQISLIAVFEFLFVFGHFAERNISVTRGCYKHNLRVC